MSRQIKSGNAGVRCEEDRVIVTGAMQAPGGGPADTGGPTITVSATEPAAPANGDLWVDTDN